MPSILENWRYCLVLRIFGPKWPLLWYGRHACLRENQVFAWHICRTMSWGAKPLQVRRVTLRPGNHMVPSGINWYLTPIHLVTFFNCNFPLPKENLWMVYQPTSMTAMHMVCVLRMMPFTRYDQMQLPAAGRTIGATGESMCFTNFFKHIQLLSGFVA